MSALPNCPDCGASLPPGAPHGLCPQCLLRGGLGEPGLPDDAATAETALPTPRVESVAAPLEVSVGQVIGRYKLLEKVGEGGCGVVYVAEQTEPVRRRVALKVIKAGMDTQQVIARFEAERQALAMMDHPNIARVLDGGSIPQARDRPFFVMELVRGIRITDYCDENCLPTEERLDLFIKVCQAIQHAHQKGIIHRDIKPSNVLVTVNDGTPVPKVIDFGIAKATEGRLTDATVYTQLHQFIGTPAYMSPEQAEMTSLDIDTRSDIYSLGVLLYELLAGRTPFDAKELMSRGLLAMRQTIREKEPTRPSTRLATLQGDELTTTAKRRSADTSKLLHQLQGDLDWIVMKCLEKDRTRRYETANGLAADLRRHLNDEPVTAGPPSARYRFEKFVRRNRGQVIAGGVVAAALVLGMVGTTWGLIEARRQGRLASARLDQVQGEQRKADEASRIARAVRDFLQQKLLGQADVTAQANALLQVGRPASEARENPTILELLDRAAGELAEDRIEANFPNQPLLQAEILDTVGITYVGIGGFDRGIGFLRRAEELRKRHLGPDHPATLTSRSNLGAAYREAGKPELGLPLIEETLNLQRAKLGPDHPDTLNSMRSLAVAYWQVKRFEKSIPLFEALRQRAQGGGGPGGQDDLLLAGDLGINYLEAGRLSEALPLLEETLRHMQVKLGIDHPYTLTAVQNLAGAYQRTGKFDLAVSLGEEALKLARAKFGPDRPKTLLAMGNLASAYQDAGRADQALKLAEETLKLRQGTLGPDHPQTLMAMNNLATACFFANQIEKAIPLFEETIKRLEAKLGPDHLDTLLSRHSLARSYQTAGKLDVAVPLLEETLKRMRTQLGSDNPKTLMTMGSLAGAYQTAGRLDLTLPLLEEEMKIRRAKFGPDDTNTLNSMFNLADAYQATGKLGPALPLLEETLELRRARLGSDHLETLLTMSKLAPAYWWAGRLDQSIPLFEETLKRTEARFGRDHSNTLITLANLGVNYRDAGRLQEALPLLEEAYRASRGNAQMRWISHTLVETYAKAGENAKALAVRRALLADARTAVPPDSPELAELLAPVAQGLLAENEWAEAEPLARECLAIRERALPDDWRTFNAKSMLGGALLGQKRYAEAEPLLLEGYRGMTARQASIPPPGRPRIPETLARLVALYEAVDKPAQAAAWKQKLAESQHTAPAHDGKP